MTVCVGRVGRAQLGWLISALWVLSGLTHASCCRLAGGVWLVPDVFTGLICLVWLEKLGYLGLSLHKSQGSSAPRRLEQKLQDPLEVQAWKSLLLHSIKIHHKASLMGWASKNIWPVTTLPCTGSLTYLTFWACFLFLSNVYKDAFFMVLYYMRQKALVSGM